MSWLSYAELKRVFGIGRDRAEAECRSGAWPQGYVWQKLAEGRTGRVVFRSEAIELWLSLKHEPSAWEGACNRWAESLPLQKPKNGETPSRGAA